MGLRDLLATVLALVQAPSSAARWRVLGAGAGALLLVLAIVRWSATQRRRPDPRKGWHYDRLKRVVLRESLPAMIVDLDAFDSNTDWFADVARRAGKTIRLATKSLRVPNLIERVLRRHRDVYQVRPARRSVRIVESWSALDEASRVCVWGERSLFAEDDGVPHRFAHHLAATRQGLMCFSVEEGAWWVRERGASDVLVAYPTTQASDLAMAWRVARDFPDVRFVLMIDCPEHVRLLAGAWRAQAATLEGLAAPPLLRVCIDVDMSYRPLPGVHLGAHRSPCRSVEDVRAILDCMRGEGAPPLALSGVMGYEAHVAGLMDDSPFAGVLNVVARALKWMSMPELVARRRHVADFLRAQHVALDFFNGGGSGSAELSCEDPTISEVTVGSGLLQSQIFDYFEDNHARPAFCFGLRITRNCDRGIVCCQSGGFVASGEVSRDKTPRPFLPLGVAEFAAEGFGEVQTPLRVDLGDPDASALRIGDPVFFRPAKAGEIAERFSEYLITRREQSELVGRWKTYRGLGFTFY